MKKILVLTITMLMLFSTVGITAFAQDSDQINVYITISDKDGKLVLTQEKITVTDVDEDNVLTINDALYNAHEAKYDGGAKAGYEFVNSAYGISLNRLWGTANGGSYGYYINNKSPLSLADEVKDGDYINAFIYTDLTAWSDTYCYFDVNTATVEAGEEFSLKLLASAYDSEYNPIEIPVENAVITVNGENTSIKTNAEGVATIKIDNGGEYIISATSDTQVLVPPVTIMNVVGNEAPSATEATEITTATESTSVIPTSPATENATSSNEKTSPKTGVNTENTVFVIFYATLLVSVLALVVGGKKKYEG